MRLSLLLSVLCALLLLVSAQTWAFPLTPNSQITTGSLCTKGDADYVGDRYAEKIAYCQRNVTTPDKAQIYRKYNIPRQCWNRYTIDHFYPLSMGGSNHADNLWPEHKLVKNTRHNLELETFQRLQNGEITRKEALDLIKNEKMHPGSPEIDNSKECDKQD